MNHVNNIPTGLLVPAQVPLDAKRVVLTNEILENLGVDNHLAFTYEDGLIVFSVASRQRWEWRQRRTPVEGDTSLLTTDFVYPDGHVIAGIDYSLKAFNFFLKREAFLLSNIGSGDPVYKGFNAVNEKHEFYTLKTDNKIRLSYPSGDPGVLLFTAPGVDSFSTFGTSIYKGYDSNENEFQFYTLDSTDIKITQDVNTGIINLSLPQSSSIPTIYISQDYTPTYDDWFKANRLANGTPINTFEYKGEGTLAKPFTNTIKYVLGNDAIAPAVTANTAIQNGLDYYQGPSNTRKNPLKRGQKIQILRTTYAYGFDGDFNYTDLDLEIYGYVISNNPGKLLDMDDPNYFINTSDENTNVTIYLDLEAVLQIKGTGFWNSGHDIPGQTFIYSKSVNLLGKGKILSYENSASKYIINSCVNPSAINYNNAGHSTFGITCKIYCPGSGNTAPYGGQGIIQNGGLGKIELRDGAEISLGSLTARTNTNIIPVKITGGFVRVFDSIIGFVGSNNGGDNGPGITTAISLNKIGDLDTTGGPLFYAVNTSFRGYAETWFDRAGQAGNLILSNCSTIYFGGTNLIKSTGTTTVWGGSDQPTRGAASLKNNTFDFVNIDTEKINLTINGYQAVFNTIGQNLIQSLKVYSSKQDAAIYGGLPPGAVFIKRSYISDKAILSQFKIGDNFRIAIQSTPPTNFASMHSGPPSITNAVGDQINYNGTFGTVPTFEAGATIHYDEICVMT